MYYLIILGYFDLDDEDAVIYKYIFPEKLEKLVLSIEDMDYPIIREMSLIDYDEYSGDEDIEALDYEFEKLSKDYPEAEIEIKEIRKLIQAAKTLKLRLLFYPKFF